MTTTAESVPRALWRSFRHAEGTGAWLSLGLMLIVVAGTGTYLLLDPRTHRIDRLSSLLAMLTWFLGMSTLNLTAHLHGKWRRDREPRLNLLVRGGDDPPVLRYSSQFNDPFDAEPPDPAVRAVPVVAAIGCALLGFSAAMTLVAAWTAAGMFRRGWADTAVWLTLIVFLIVTAIWRVSREVSDIYQWGLDQRTLARASAHKRADN